MKTERNRNKNDCVCYKRTRNVIATNGEMRRIKCSPKKTKTKRNYISILYNIYDIGDGDDENSVRLWIQIEMEDVVPSCLFSCHSLIRLLIAYNNNRWELIGIWMKTTKVWNIRKLYCTPSYIYSKEGRRKRYSKYRERWEELQQKKNWKTLKKKTLKLIE